MILILLGFLTGFLGGTLGIGGGMILVPVLTLFAGYSWEVASSTSLFCILVASLLVSHKKLPKKLVHLDLAKDIEGLGCLFGFLGFLLASYLTDSTLNLLLAAVLSILFVQNSKKTYQEFFAKNHNPSTSQPSPQTSSNHTYYGYALFAFAGLTSGALGIGSGLLLVSSLHLVWKHPLNISSATSSYAMGSISTGALMGYGLWGYINWYICAMGSLGVIAGSYMGSYISEKTHPKWLRLWLCIILCLITGLLWKKTLV